MKHSCTKAKPSFESEARFEHLNNELVARGDKSKLMDLFGH